MTNDIITFEILPPLRQNDPPEPGDDSADTNICDEHPDIAAPRTLNDFPAPPGESTPPPPSRTRAVMAVKITLVIFTVAVFIFAMYTEVSSAISKFVPDSFSDAVAAIVFGGYYAIDKQPNNEGDSVMRPPNNNSGDLPPEWDVDENADPVDTSGDPADETESENTTADSEENPPDVGSEGGDITDPDRYPIVARDLSTNAKRGLVCSNQTSYDLDLDYFADNEFALPPLSELMASFPPDTDNPVVLIVHTHGTESYAEEGSTSYSKKDNSRTTDITKNVVAVGEVMAEYFESHGIPTVHCTEMFDRDSYINAYNNSSAAVREYLAIYPSIRYIFDVHRDSIIADDYTKYRPVTEIDGTPTAQFMCVVGTNAKGAAHPLWRDNLTLAAHLQVRLWNRSESLPRRLSIRSASFYQQYAQGSLLLEIGSCGNTLSEAKACALIVAEELAEIIIAGE